LSLLLIVSLFLQAPEKKLANPIELFRHGSFHGGIWRQAYKIGSIGEMAALLFYLNQAKPYLALGLASGVAAAAYFLQLLPLPVA
jgi:hypothetical protein